MSTATKEKKSTKAESVPVEAVVESTPTKVTKANRETRYLVLLDRVASGEASESELSDLQRLAGGGRNWQRDLNVVCQIRQFRKRAGDLLSARSLEEWRKEHTELKGRILPAARALMDVEERQGGMPLGVRTSSEAGKKLADEVWTARHNLEQLQGEEMELVKRIKMIEHCQKQIGKLVADNPRLFPADPANVERLESELADATATVARLAAELAAAKQ